jgi:hypothetical protein
MFNGFALQALGHFVTAENVFRTPSIEDSTLQTVTPQQF